MTFQTGLPDMESVIETKYGRATFAGHREDGTIYLYIGSGRTLAVPGKTEWRYVIKS